MAIDWYITTLGLFALAAIAGLILYAVIFTSVGDWALTPLRAAAYCTQYGKLAGDPHQRNPFLDGIPAWHGAHRTILSSDHTFDAHLVLWELHSTLQTPIVRTGPNQVHLADGESQRIIFNFTNPYDKGRLYAIFDDNRVANLFTFRSKEDHAKRRKLLSHVYAPTTTRTLRPFISHKLVALLEYMRKRCAVVPVPIDMFVAFQTLTSDVTIKFAFEQDHKMVQTGQLNSFLMDLRTRIGATLPARRASHLTAKFPLFTALIGLLPRHMQEQIRAINRIDAQTRRMVEAVVAGGANESGQVFRKLASVVDESTGSKASLEVLVAETRNVLLAGIETTAVTLTYVAWRLAKDPTLYDAVLEELRTLMPTVVTEESHLPSVSELAKLPLVDAVLKEVQRCYPAVPKALPRVVPLGGVTLHGHYLPAGTEVTCSNYVQHRWQQAGEDEDELWGPDPLEFRPTRWLEAKSNPRRLAEMERNLVPFSTGPRACMGKDLAKDILYLTVAALFRSMRPCRPSGGEKDDEKMTDVIVPSDESMELVGFFTGAPRGHRMEIQWECVEA